MPVLGYWSIRALAEPIRTLLSHAGVDFEDKTYDIGPPPTYDRSSWFDVKPNMGLDLPNLPYYIDGNVKLTESSAIIRHLARKHGLAGTTEEEMMRIDVAESVCSDQMKGIVSLIFNPNYDENAKAAFLAGIKNQIQKLATIIGAGPYVTGQKISYADFLVLEQLDRYLDLCPKALDEFPSLQAFQKRMLDLPGVKARRSSPSFQKIKTRHYGRMAKAGHGEESY
ncbi:Glutathione S-transferase N-terminal [Trinorchestia longiramus]|nr:Glutathione S-transferase N-terminal [Trinorchestia longiramus]